MTEMLQSPAGQSILNSSSTGAGDWYRVHHKIKNLTFQVVHQATSAGASVSSTTLIEVSNDGVNPLGTPAATIVLAGDTLVTDGFTLDAHYDYVRAKFNSIGAATAGSTGSGFSLNVKVSAHLGSG